MILLAFILGFPANEIVLPMILMAYTASGTLAEIPDIQGIRAILTAHGWGLGTAMSMTVFTLFHFPCATTCLTIKKETGSLKWTALSMALPTVCGAALCVIIHFLGGLF